MARDMDLFDENETECLKVLKSPKKEAVPPPIPKTPLEEGKTIIYVPHYSEGVLKAEIPITLELATSNDIKRWAEKVAPGLDVEKFKLKELSGRRKAFDYVIYCLRKLDLSAENYIPKKRKKEEK